MPKIFGEKLSIQDQADIITYLLQQTGGVTPAQPARRFEDTARGVVGIRSDRPFFLSSAALATSNHFARPGNCAIIAHTLEIAGRAGVAAGATRGIHRRSPAGRIPGAKTRFAENRHDRGQH